MTTITTPDGDSAPMPRRITITIIVCALLMLACTVHALWLRRIDGITREAQQTDILAELSLHRDPAIDSFIASWEELQAKRKQQLGVSTIPPLDLDRLERMRDQIHRDPSVAWDLHKKVVEEVEREPAYFPTVLIW